MLLSRERGPLKDFIRSLLGQSLRGKTEVEDILQETFLKAIRSIRKFCGGTESAFRGWLMAIARNEVQVLARRLRGKLAAQGREVSLALTMEAGGKEFQPLAAALAAETLSPLKILRQKERFERLKKALRSLSVDHQEVILLARLKGLPMKEVAHRMGRSPKAVSVLLVRALKKLRKAFGSTDSLHLPARSLEEEEAGGGP